MTTTKKELSYFRLKLEAYLGEHFPERVNENTFITDSRRRSIDNLLRCYSTRFFSPRGRGNGKRSVIPRFAFSKYDTLVSVLENEFEKELPSPLPERLTPMLLKNKAVQSVFDSMSWRTTLVQVQSMRNSTPNWQGQSFCLSRSMVCQR